MINFLYELEFEVIIWLSALCVSMFDLYFSTAYAGHEDQE